MEPCPVCDSTTNAKFEKTSTWCKPCVDDTLVGQRAERFAPVQKQIIDPYDR